MSKPVKMYGTSDRRALMGISENALDLYFYCESTDTKPTEDVPKYAMALELDTGALYYFDGTEWKVYGWNKDME